MFTGLIEEIGRVVAVVPRGNLTRLELAARAVLTDARLGDSLCHNGVCLTIAELGDGRYGCDVMAETLRVTTLGGLRPGDRVNLERALAAGGRLGGHFVQGHVDGVGEVLAVDRDDQWVRYTIAAPQPLRPQIVAKGSIAVDGVSLTVVDTPPGAFRVALIPHTLEHTILGDYRAGRPVNLETDVLAKYVAAALGRDPGAGGTMTWDWLAEHGF